MNDDADNRGRSGPAGAGVDESCCVAIHIVISWCLLTQDVVDKCLECFDRATGSGNRTAIQ